MGVRLDSVVAVSADMADGGERCGSGFLLPGGRVLTAWHCCVNEHDTRTTVAVRRASDGAAAGVIDVVACPDLDVAVLTIDPGVAWAVSAEPLSVGRVDQRNSGQLHDCQAIGFPLFQRDPKDQRRNTAELHGTIRRTEDAISGYLVMRDVDLRDVSLPATDLLTHDRRGSPWAGLSGALVFYDTRAIGVVLQHHPRQGSSAFRILPLHRIAYTDSEDARAVAEALMLPDADLFPIVADRSNSVGRLAERVELARMPSEQEESNRQWLQLMKDLAARLQLSSWARDTAFVTMKYPQISIMTRDRWHEGATWINNRFWPPGQPALRETVKTFGKLLGDFLDVMDVHADQYGQNTWRACFPYRRMKGHRQYVQWFEEWLDYASLIDDLALELTRYGNLIIALVRENLNSTFFTEEGALTFRAGSSGSIFEGGERYWRAEFDFDPEVSECDQPYQGLTDFELIRHTRSLHSMRAIKELP